MTAKSSSCDRPKRLLSHQQKEAATERTTFPEYIGDDKRLKPLSKAKGYVNFKQMAPWPDFAKIACNVHAHDNRFISYD